MAEVESGTNEAAPGWRQKAAFWLMLALAAFWIAGGVNWVVTTGSDWLGMAWAVVMAGLTVVAAFGTRKANTGWHLFARVVLAAPLFGALILRGSLPSVSPLEATLGLTWIAALVLLGRSGLGPDGGPFAPTRFRGLLIFMILVAGVMAFSSFSVVVEGIVGRLRFPDSTLPWEMEVRRLLYLFVYAVTAVGLYRMRAAALLVPLLLGGYLLFRSFAPSPSISGSGPIPEEVRQEIISKARWEGIRYSTFVLLMVVPFLGALGWLRLRARRERGKVE